MAGSSATGGFVVSGAIEITDQFSAVFEKFGEHLKKVEETVKNISKAFDKNLTVSVEKTAEKVEKKVESIASKLNKMGGSFQSIGKKLSLYVSAPLAAFAVGSLKAAGDVEALGTSLYNFTGSAEKANALLSQLLQTSSRSTFGLNEIGSASKILLGVGHSVDTINDKIKMLSDIGATFNIPLESLTEQLVASEEAGFNFMQAKNLAKQGVPIFKELATYIQQATGVKYSDKQIKKFLQDGRISGKALEGVFKNLTKEGNLAFNGMERNTNNFKGALARLKNAGVGFTESFGKALLDLGATKHLDKMAERVNNLTLKFNEFVAKNPEAIAQFAKLGAILVGLPAVLLAVGTAFKTVATLITAHPLIAALTGITTAVLLVLQYQDEINSFIDKHSTSKLRQFNEQNNGILSKVAMKNSVLERLLEDPNKYIVKSPLLNSQKQEITSSSEIKINLNDPGKYIKNIASKQSGVSNLNIGINNSPAMSLVGGY